MVRLSTIPLVIRADYPASIPQTSITVKYYLSPAVVKTVPWASPDLQNGAVLPLKFTTGVDQRGWNV